MRVRFVRPPVASRRCAPPLLTLAALVATLAAPGYRAFARDDVPPLRGRIGDIAVVGTRLEADGRLWAPHGLNSFAFIAAPTVRGGLFRAAHDAYDMRRVAAMKEWGIDTVRFLVAQPALDARSDLYDAAFRDELVAGVELARDAGLAVIVCMQDERGTGEASPAALPNEGTARAWRSLAPAFAHDRGVMYELMNEPQPHATPANWAAWAKAMNGIIAIVRDAGARNVLVADGLDFAEQLDGAPMLVDPLRQIAYAVHPYAHAPVGQTPRAWDRKFGNASVGRFAPIVVSEWSLENDVAAPAPDNAFQYCDADSNAAALAFLRYLDRHRIGLIAVAYDLPNQPRVSRDGRATVDERGTPTTLVGTGCADARFGPGTILRQWFRSGAVPMHLE